MGPGWSTASMPTLPAAFWCVAPVGLKAAQAQFAAGRAHKTYWAVVRGVPATGSGTIDAPLLRLNTRGGWRMIIDDAGKPAVTDWRLLGQTGKTAWLELTPHTGRTHQVRVHCAALGFPVLGDPVYDGGAGPLQLLARALALRLDLAAQCRRAGAGTHARGFARLWLADRLGAFPVVAPDAGGDVRGTSPAMTMPLILPNIGTSFWRPPWHRKEIGFMSLREKGAITGVGETQYMRGTDRTPLSLQLEASLNAIADAGLKPTDIDGVIPYGHGAVAEDFITNFGIPDLRFSATTPMGGASAVAAIQCAVAAISAGICNHVLLSLGRTGYSGGRIGARVQQMPQFRLIGEFEMPSGAIAPAQLYAAMARRHMELYGTTSRQFAEIAVTTRRHASLNPNATMRNPITIEDHQASRMISDPLRLLDCSLESDGGTAVVISAAERAKDMKQRPVVIMGVAEGHPEFAERDHPASRPDHARPRQGGAESICDGRRDA